MRAQHYLPLNILGGAYIGAAGIKVEVGVVLGDVTWLVDATAFVTGPACIVEVAELIAVSAEVEGLTGLGVVGALSTPTTRVHLDAGAVGPEVVEGNVPEAHFFCSGNINRGVVENDLGGKAVVGVGTGEGVGAVAAALLELEELLLLVSNTLGGMVNAGVEGPVMDDFGTEGVVPFQGDSVVDQL